MQNLNHREFTKLKSSNGFYNIGIHPVMDNVLTATLSDVPGRVCIPADRWAIDIYTEKLSAILTSADMNGVYFQYYSIANTTEERSCNENYSLFATWEDLGIHRCAVIKDSLENYKALFRDYIYSRFYYHVLQTGSKARHIVMHWLHDVDDRDQMWTVDKYDRRVIRQGDLYFIYQGKSLTHGRLPVEKILMRMFK